MAQGEGTEFKPQYQKKKNLLFYKIPKPFTAYIPIKSNFFKRYFSRVFLLLQ
jgi:hypothetical protein